MITAALALRIFDHRYITSADHQLNTSTAGVDDFVQHWYFGDNDHTDTNSCNVNHQIKTSTNDVSDILNTSTSCEFAFSQ